MSCLSSTTSGASTPSQAESRGQRVRARAMVGRTLRRRAPLRSCTSTTPVTRSNSAANLSSAISPTPERRPMRMSAADTPRLGRCGRRSWRLSTFAAVRHRALTQGFSLIPKNPHARFIDARRTRWIPWASSAKVAQVGRITCTTSASRLPGATFAGSPRRAEARNVWCRAPSCPILLLVPSSSGLYPASFLGGCLMSYAGS